MKISIVIPTRERVQYLPHAIQTALDIDDPNIEIVVSDNASTDGTEEVVKSFADPRLIYVNTRARLSMRQNFNHAFHATSGDYLIYFGDDDGIIPGQFPFLRQILETHRPDGVSWIRATYGWPVPGFGKKTGGVRVYRDKSFGTRGFFSGTLQRDKILAADISDIHPVPDIYHGCVSRDYLIRSAINSDVIFDSSIPDVNVTYRAALRGGLFYAVDHPFSINGYSPASTGGGHSAGQKNQTDTSSSAQFNKENQTDTFTDVMQHAGSVGLAFFSTLETVQRNHHLNVGRPDYDNWYRFVLGSVRKNPDMSAKVRDILTAFAAENGTTDALGRALKSPPRSKRTLGERLTRMRSQLRSVRVSTAHNAENTILTAARVTDSILGDDFGAVSAGDMTHSAAWSRAKRRSKAFKREL